MMTLKKDEYLKILETAFGYAKTLIMLWHEKSIEHIRLTSANKKHLTDYKQKQIIDGMKLKGKLIQQGRQR